MRTDRFTLAAIAVAAVLAAFLTSTWIPGNYTPGPLLTWAVTYTGTICGLAALTRMPVGRTLITSTLLVTQGLVLLLTGIRQAIDGLILALDRARSAGVALLATTTEAA